MKSLKSSAIKNVLSDPAWGKSENLSSQLGHEVYRNSDSGEVLVVFDGTIGRLYESDVEVRAVATRRAGDVSHVLEGRLPDGSEFLKTIPELVGRLGDVLPVRLEAMDGSIESLKEIDRVLHQVGRERGLSSEVLPSVVAYVGEVVRRATGGEWQLRISDDGRIGEPWLATASGKSVAVFWEVLKELYDEYPFSIAGRVAGLLGTMAKSPHPTKKDGR